jgi:hypothetical protein
LSYAFLSNKDKSQQRRLKAAQTLVLQPHTSEFSQQPV